jgi:uroporphyrinogen-III synthase
VTLVLNTRPREQAQELSRLLASAGLAVVEAPAIAVVPSWHDAELSAVRRALLSQRYAWVVLPSQNAAHGLERELSSVPVMCGVSTAKALSLHGATTLERFSATAAVAGLRDLLTPGDRVLVPRAAEGRDELVDGLRAVGALVDSPIAYRTVAVQDAAVRLDQGGIDVVTLCSPSAVRAVAPAVHGEVVVCLGETTAAMARELGLRVGGVANMTSMPALVEAVQAALQEVRV